MSTTKQKILVAYFPRTGENYNVGYIKKGNTRIIAEIIAKKTNGDLFEIEPAKAYPDDYDACVNQATKEREQKARPDIKTDKSIDDYDIIFIGYPIWWSDAPMPVYTWIEKHKWQGKTVIPFCTHEGSGLGDTQSYLKKSCAGAEVKKGLAITGTTAQRQPAEAEKMIADWLQKLK